MHRRLFYSMWGFTLLAACGQQGPVVTEQDYEGRSHLVVETAELTYWYDVKGGGFSRIIDPDGKDWIHFRVDPWGAYPASAASSFRGLPNLVFQGEDNGAGHPGWDQCSSRVEKDRIITKSLSGRWEWQWTFHEAHAVLDVLKCDSTRNYWFLYEGTPGGTFDPAGAYAGTDQGGPLPATQGYVEGSVLRDQFRWMYAGRRDGQSCLYMLQMEADTLADMLSYLGNSEAGLDSQDGMTVFGFGRGAGATPLLSKEIRFVIGMYPAAIRSEQDHQELASFLQKEYLNN